MKILLTGWNAGLEKVRLTQAIKGHSHLGLASSKKMVDDLLEGEVVSLDFESESGARAFKEMHNPWVKFAKKVDVCILKNGRILLANLTKVALWGLFPPTECPEVPVVAMR